MRNLIISLVCLFGVFELFSQHKIDFEEHIKSIREESFISSDLKGEFNANERSVNYALNYLKRKGVKKKYITNRNLLHKIRRINCEDSLSIHFCDNLKNGKKLELKITFKKFNFNARKFEVNSFDNILVNLSVGKVNDKLHGNIGKWSKELGGRGAVKGLEHVFKVGSSITTSTFSNYMFGN